MKAAYPIWAMLALVLVACTQTGSEVAASAAMDDDPTGLSSEISSRAQAARAAEEEDSSGAGMNLAAIAVPLQEVAQGRTDRPNMMANVANTMSGMRNQLMARQAMSIAQTVAGGAMSGGIGLVAAAPGLAMQAASTGMMMSTMASAEAQVQQAMVQMEAQRAAEQILPDEDRPAAAQALLNIVDGPSGRSATWRNPQTGSSGRVTLRRDHRIPGGIACRSVRQEWKRGSDSKAGETVICRQSGIWYDVL